jgi:hypothetical protein
MINILKKNQKKVHLKKKLNYKNNLINNYQKNNKI